MKGKSVRKQISISILEGNYVNLVSQVPRQGSYLIIRKASYWPRFEHTYTLAVQNDHSE